MDYLILAKTPNLAISDENQLFDCDKARVKSWEGVAMSCHQFVKMLLAVDPHFVNWDLGSVFRVSVNLHSS